jgi:hypothetical protein
MNDRESDNVDEDDTDAEDDCDELYKVFGDADDDNGDAGGGDDDEDVVK